jgi:hypothetical protein
MKQRCKNSFGEENLFVSWTIVFDEWIILAVFWNKGQKKNSTENETFFNGVMIPL